MFLSPMSVEVGTNVNNKFRTRSKSNNANFLEMSRQNFVVEEQSSAGKDLNHII